MSEQRRLKRIYFRNYKAFRQFSVSLDGFNVLVGPNNAGKSTIVGALRILAEGLQRARAKAPQHIDGPQGLGVRGYPIKLEGLRLSTENVFYNYDDTSETTIEFTLDNENKLLLYFPFLGECYLIPECSKGVRTPADFKREYNFYVSFVPVLGPVDYNERLFQKEAARLALLSSDASRNFRNIWYHFPDGFEEFRETIQRTWPGMDVNPPELIASLDKAYLRMFCDEERYPREIFWAGFGFQVWCQMLTFLIKGKGTSLLVVDEPDIYLHSDLQRQLVGILEDLGPNILLATHSTEIISHVDSKSLLNVDKRNASASRVRDSKRLHEVFSLLGSSLNPTLTQLAKTRRVLFVEGKDFQIMSRFAKKLGMDAVSNRSEFAVVQANGFNPTKVKNFADGMELTLGLKLLKMVIFDRDYRSGDEVASMTAEMENFAWYAVIHSRKELENFLLDADAIERALRKQISRKHPHGDSDFLLEEDLCTVFQRLSDPMKNSV